MIYKANEIAYSQMFKYSNYYQHNTNTYLLTLILIIMEIRKAQRKQVKKESIETEAYLSPFI